MEEKHTIDSIIAKYGQPVPKKPKKWLLVIVALLVILVSAGVAVSALELAKNMPVKTPTATEPVTGGPTPSSVIDKIASNGTITASKNYLLFRVDPAKTEANTDTTKIIYPQSGYDFITNVVADDGLRFTLTDAKLTSNRIAMTAAIEDVLKSDGFTKKSQDVSALTSYETASYTNNGTICQITNYANSKQAVSILEQGILCVTQTSLEKSYSNVKTLLMNADPSVVASTKAVNQSVVSSDTKKLLTLTTTPKDSATTTNYYYATLDKDYTYIGKRATPSVDNEASYTISDELKKNITDAKWGSFLSDNIK
ncbi:MAG TPA: hypothetical protein VIM37_00210 [Candidatus Microsaccharimonas sp.]